MVDLSAIDLNNLIEVDQSQLVLSSSNRAGLGITISKQGLITFQKLLANDLGEDLGTIELKIDKTGKVLVICVSKDSGPIKRQKTKNAFSCKRQLKQLIQANGVSEVRNRWIKMFADKNRYEIELEFNSFSFDQDDGMHRKGDVFLIDLLAGKGNKQRG